MRGILAAGLQLPYWHGVMGERLRFGKLLGMGEAQAKDAAATTSSSLGEVWVFSLPPAVPTYPLSPSVFFSGAENVFVLPFVFTSGCWGREAGISVLIPPGALSSLILARFELLKQRPFELSAEMSAGRKTELVGFALKIK